MKLKRLFALFCDKTFVRFVLVGIVNTLFGTGIMFLFYNVFHLGYWLSSFSNYFFGSILSYFLNKYFTFRAKEKSWREIVLFVVNISVCYLIAYGVAKPLMLWLLSECSRVVQENIAMLVGMCLFVALNYIGQRVWVFGRKESIILFSQRKLSPIFWEAHCTQIYLEINTKKEEPRL